MKFTPEFIERVAEANNIVDVISPYTQLKPSGGGLMGRCPFPDHPEKTASFSVSETKQVYHCFGCKKSGNIFSFLQQYNGMSFREAVEFLAHRAHIALPVEDKQESDKQDLATQKKRKVIEANKLAANYFREVFKRLPENHPAKVYAEKRGLDPETQNEFLIGYCSEEWDGLLKYLESKGISAAVAEEAKLVKARAQGKSGHFDLFRERLMFPILSTMGEVLAFGGRIIEKGEPKYLNSPETLAFHKGRVLYGLYHSAKYIRSEDSVLVVEGYMDLIALYKNGIRNVVAPMGTALTFDQAKILRRSTKNVVVLFDGDSAGIAAAERSLPVLLEADLHPKGLILPDELDPDEYIAEHGVQALKDKIHQATDLLTVVLSQWMQGYRGEASQKVQLADKLRPVFSSMQDPRLKQLYVVEVAQKMGVDERWLKTALSTQNSTMAQKPQENLSNQNKPTQMQNSAAPAASAASVANEVPETKIVLKGVPPAEQLLMAMALKSRANFEIFLNSEVTPALQHQGAKEVLERAATVYRQAPEKFDKLTSLLTTFVDNPALLMAGLPLGKEETEIEVANEEDSLILKDCIRKVRDLFLQNQIKQVTLELKAESSTEKLSLLAKLQKERIQLTKL
ncbi:MAG: DNA primase [Pseudobdellovibrionaceae bacterium]